MFSLALLIANANIKLDFCLVLIFDDCSMIIFLSLQFSSRQYNYALDKVYNIYVIVENVIPLMMLRDCMWKKRAK